MYTTVPFFRHISDRNIEIIYALYHKYVNTYINNSGKIQFTRNQRLIVSLAIIPHIYVKTDEFKKKATLKKKIQVHTYHVGV